MNKILLFFGIILTVSCSNKSEKPKSAENLSFSDYSRKEYLKNRQDSSTWDTAIFNSELKNMNNRSTGPFTYGVFPTPKYDLIGKGTCTGLGNFAYTGSGEYYEKIEDKTILYNSFFVKKNKLNNTRLGNRDDKIFFQIIVLTDNIDPVNFTHLNSQIISRNHPDYIGQGYYKTKNNKIDYAAFITANSDSYAIINTRLFDLNFGKTILIAPQKDRSFRSMQIKSPMLSSEEIESYTNQLLKEEKVIDFFTKSENI